MLNKAPDPPSDDLPEDLKLLLLDPSVNKEQIINYLTAQDQYRSSFIFNAVLDGEHSKIKMILSYLQADPEILQQVLMQEYIFSRSILLQAISSQKPEIVNDILSSLQGHKPILLSVLKQVDESNDSSLHKAILLGHLVIVKNILSSLKTYPLLLRAVLMQENKSGNSVLLQAISSQNTEIIEEILLSLRANPYIISQVLMQKDKDGRQVLYHAIYKGNLQIVEKILAVVDEKTRDIIFEELDSRGNKILFEALEKVISNSDENKNPEEILKLLVKHKFKIDLNQSQILALTSFYKNHALLALMSQPRYGIGDKYNPHLLTKILNDVVASSESRALKENRISKIYATLIPRVNSNQPIKIDEQDLYVYYANSNRHASYVIFNVDQTTNKLKSISYCDSHFYPKLGDKRPHQDSLLPARVFGVREFELEGDLEFSKEFAQKFITQNFQDKDITSLQLPFVVDLKPIAIKEEIKRTVETTEQRRENCSYKNANVLACYLLQELTGQNYSQDYQQFKKQLRVEVIEGLVSDYKKIKEQLGEEFVEHLGIKERLQKVASQKFGSQKSELLKTTMSKAISSIEAFDSDYRSRAEEPSDFFREPVRSSEVGGIIEVKSQSLVNPRGTFQRPQDLRSEPTNFGSNYHGKRPV